MNKPSRSSRGRRTGSPDTRSEILRAARSRFLSEGYQTVSMRTVAADAGVDAALISYYFGSKRGLFGAALALSANPPEILLHALAGDPDTMPERILRALILAWDDPQHGEPLRVLVNTAVSDPEVRNLVRDVLEHEMFDRLADHLDGPHARYRAAAFGTQLAGVVLTRYVLELDPVASMSVDELVHHLTPGLRAALSGRPGPPHRHRPPVGAAGRASGR